MLSEKWHMYRYINIYIYNWSHKINQTVADCCFQMPDDLCSVAGNCAINVVCHKCKKTTIGAWHAFCTSTLASKRVVKLQPTASLCVYISTYTHIHQFICIHRPTHIWRSNAFYMYIYIYICVCRKANQSIYIETCI